MHQVILTEYILYLQFSEHSTDYAQSILENATLKDWLQSIHNTKAHSFINNSTIKHIEFSPNCVKKMLGLVNKFRNFDLQAEVFTN